MNIIRKKEIVNAKYLANERVRISIRPFSPSLSVKPPLDHYKLEKILCWIHHYVAVGIDSNLFSYLKL